MGKSTIGWCTHTFCWLSGCSHKSPECLHCYAEIMTARLATMPHAPARYKDGVTKNRRWTGRVSYDPAAMEEMWAALRRARQPMRVFTNSMSDTFHEDAPPESLADLVNGIRRFQAFREDRADTSDWRVIMLLTKRPDLMLAWQREHFPEGLPSWVWAMTTVGDQRRADERIPLLLQVKVQAGGVRGLSCEPLLSALDLGAWIGPQTWATHRFLGCAEEVEDPEHGCAGCPVGGPECSGKYDRGLGWIITGAESGPKRRETSIAWVRELRDQSTNAGIPFFLKQLFVDGKRVEAPMLDGRTWVEVPHA